MPFFQKLYSRFSELCADQKLSLFTLLDRASFLHYNKLNTKIIKFGWELFILWVISYGLSFSGFARFPEFRGTINAKLMANSENDIPQEITHKIKVLNQIWRSWCYYNKEKMLYPTKRKRITVDQSKVLKNRLFRGFWGHPVYIYIYIYIYLYWNFSRLVTIYTVV